MISYFLIAISAIISLFVWQNKSLFRYGMNRFSLSEGKYGEFAKQVGLSQFIHGDILHLVMNSYFLYSAGPVLEDYMGEPLFLGFFISMTCVNILGLLLFAPRVNTIGISGFCMAILAYLWVTLYTAGSPDAGQIGTLLVINIAIGLTPNISLVGHATGAMGGIVFWFLTRSLF